jgi:hypothetical protein
MVLLFACYFFKVSNPIPANLNPEGVEDIFMTVFSYWLCIMGEGCGHTGWIDANEPPSFYVMRIVAGGIY